MHIPTIFDNDYEGDIERYSISDEKFHHLEKVLRIKNDSIVKLTNGRGLISSGRISNKFITISETELKQRENKVNIFIAKLHDKTRMRLLIEKLTELGVQSITIAPTENSQKINITPEKINSWIIGAIEQSGAPFAPELLIEKKIDFDKFPHSFDISGDNISNNIKLKNFAIGPEGGWSKEELERFKHISKLSNFTLRSDTAALVAVSLMM